MREKSHTKGNHAPRDWGKEFIVKSLFHYPGGKMKTKTIRRPLFVTLTLLTLVALLLGSAAPALADPSPWTQTSTSDFDNGTPSNTEVVIGGSGDSGAVQLAQASGNWRIDSEAQWQNWVSHPNATTSGGTLVLDRHYAWESSPSYSDNSSASSPSAQWNWETVKTL
ncbi:MAG: hypothetical protein DRI77_04915, partial [Chloroflexi bacterium]